MNFLRSGDIVAAWEVDHVLAFGSPVLVAAHLEEQPGTRATLKVAEPHRYAEVRQRREVCALQSFDHPRIPKLIESGVADDGSVFIALRPFSGDSLSDRLVAGEVDWRLAVGWLFEVALALKHIHESGWVHRNLTPQNIYIGQGPQDVWVLGLEEALPAEQREVLDPAFSGNLAYLAPEVLADPEHHGPRADLYAFGLVAFELLSGEPAFPAAAWAHRADRELSLLEWKTRSRELDPGEGVPDWLRSLVRKCTHPESDQRLPDMDAVVSWLEGARASWEPHHTPIPDLAHGPPPPLTVQPTLVDAAQLAQALAAHQASLPGQQAGWAVYFSTAAAMGVAAGLAVSTLIVLYVELSRLA